MPIAIHHHMCITLLHLPTSMPRSKLLNRNQLQLQSTLPFPKQQGQSQWGQRQRVFVRKHHLSRQFLHPTSTPFLIIRLTAQRSLHLCSSWSTHLTKWTSLPILSSCTVLQGQWDTTSRQLISCWSLVRQTLMMAMVNTMLIMRPGLTAEHGFAQ